MGHRYIQTATLLLIFNLSINSIFGQITAPTKQGMGQSLIIDTTKQQSLEQIIGLKPGVQLKSCEVVISKDGTIYKFEHGLKNETESRLQEYLKKLRHNDILFIDNIWIIEDGKTKKLMGQKAFTIQ